MRVTGKRLRSPGLALKGRARSRDERGSIVMVLTIIVTLSILVVMVAAIAISQQNVSQKTVMRNDALEAAEAGLDAAVGEIRAANDGSGNGVVQELPCTGGSNTDGFVLTGYLDSTSSTKYTATVTYYTDSAIPTLANIGHTAETILCYPYATPSYPEAVPSYATITSVGQDPSTSPVTPPSRTINEIYSFTSDNENVPGGVITDFNGSVDDLCLSASSSDTDVTPAAGGKLYVDTCLTAGDEDQTWEYSANFTLILSSTIPTTSDPTSTELCIQGSQANDTLQLAACLSSSSSNFYLQQWGINDSGMYQAVSSSGAPASGNLCINEESNSSGSQLDLATCSGGFTDEQTWAPTPQVGAGDAGSPTQQFVNYEQFGNCIDVTNQNVGTSYLIDYMCKQFPDGASWTAQSGVNPYDPTWNQRFAQTDVTYAGNSQTYVELQTNNQPANNPNTLYCLWSPDTGSTWQSQYGSDGTGDPSGNNPAWVTVQPCPTLQSGNTVPTGSTGSYANTGFLWTVNSSTTYNVTDYYDDCLDADTDDFQQPAGGSTFATVTVASCSGDDANEEWNAPPSTQEAQESHLYEPGLSGN